MRKPLPEHGSLSDEEACGARGVGSAWFRVVFNDLLGGLREGHTVVHDVVALLELGIEVVLYDGAWEVSHLVNPEWRDSRLERVVKEAHRPALAVTGQVVNHVRWLVEDVDEQRRRHDGLLD